ncbi:MAG: ABC transporter ATP-binding protein, partial [Halobacteria archaeon]|nr:ABC transporter ATP-binding protein [Halobacteria archaeon]
MGFDDDFDDEPTVLELDEITKAFDDGDVTAVDSVSLSIREGELLTLLGPSGCGKTTTLRLIAGLERPDEGKIRLNGETVADSSTRSFVESENRDVGIVFQNFALFPHMTVEENIGFGLDGLPKNERQERVDEMLELVGLEQKREASPDELSGGQKQRVALA